MNKKAIAIALAVLVLTFVGVIRQSYTYSTVANAHPDENPAVCDIHGIAAELCTRCTPDLIADFKAQGDWCTEHNLPESQCDLCSPAAEQQHDHEIDEIGHLDAHADDVSSAYQEHDHWHEAHIDKTTGSEISVLFPENAVHCATDEAVIQLASIATAERTGITVRPALAVSSSPEFEAPAEIVFNQTATMVLATTIPALVVDWRVTPGQQVKRGDILAQLHAPGLPQMKAEYLEAHASWMLASKQLARQKELHRKHLISDGEFETDETESRLAEAHLVGRAGLLKSAGLSVPDLEEIIADRRINQMLFVRAPEDGVIIERIAILGELLDAGKPLAVIGNPDSLWIEARVRKHDVHNIRIGDIMEFASDGNGLQRCSGEIIWIARFLDEHTRTVTIRAEVKATSGIVHAGQYGRAIMTSNDTNQMVLIPRDAVQWEGCCNVVFVKETIDRFYPRKVTIAPASNGHYRVSEGLSPGEEIVVNGSYLLKTELKKGSIGAGCAGH